MTFGALVNLYMDDCKARLRPTTLENKQTLINTKVLPYFKAMPINTIEPLTVRKWQNDLLNHKSEYADTYLKTIHNQLSAIFNFAVKYYKLPSNPARICGAIGKKNASSMDFWIQEEFEKFIAVVSDKPASKTIFPLLFWTGMRSGELLALTLDDFDFLEKTVSINKNYARHKGKDLIMEPKTPKSKRIIALPNFVCSIVLDYANKLYDYKPNERLFHFTKYYLTHEMIRGVKKSGVKKIRIHDLRHSHASLLVEEGFSILLISERLGHENIETTLQTYSHLYPNKQGEVAIRLDELNKIMDSNDTEEK
jgi:integrase